jgi:hypothetical protein
MTDEMIKRVVMRRIYAIYWWRRISGSPLAKMTVLGIFVGSELMLVSVIDVYNNARGLSDFNKMIGYLFHAFTGTDLVVQILSIAASLIVALGVRDLIKNFPLTIPK